MAYYNTPYYQYPYMYQQNQSYTNQSRRTMDWVEGEVGAKAFQQPPDWPVNQPLPLWDSTEKKIFLKSWNQMGMANPLQELDYEMKEQPSPLMLEGMSGKEAQYVTKEDLDELKQMVQKLTDTMNKQNKTRGEQQ